MRNVIRLVGMFWLIENALQVGTVGDPERAESRDRGTEEQGLQWGRHSVINVRLSCKFKFVQAKSKKAAQEISGVEGGEGLLRGNWGTGYACSEPVGQRGTQTQLLLLLLA